MAVHLLGHAKFSNAYMASEEFVVSHCHYTRVDNVHLHKSFTRSLKGATILHEVIRVPALVSLHHVPLHGRMAPGGK